MTLEGGKEGGEAKQTETGKRIRISCQFISQLRQGLGKFNLGLGVSKTKHLIYYSFFLKLMRASYRQMALNWFFVRDR